MRQEIVFQFIGAIPTRPVGIFELIPKIPCEAWRVFSFSPQKVRWASRHRSFVWFLPYVNELWNKISLWSGWSLFLLWSRFHRQNGFLHLKCDPNICRLFCSLGYTRTNTLYSISFDDSMVLGCIIIYLLDHLVISHWQEGRNHEVLCWFYFAFKHQSQNNI